MSTIERWKKLVAQLKDKKYRDAFVSEHIATGIPFQIRAIRKKIPWTQKELAEHAGMLQERISLAENPNYARFNIQTLKKIASAFDVALIVRFVPFGELVKWELNLSSESLGPVSFEEDPYFQPPVTNFVAQGGFVLGGESIMSVYYPETKPKTKVFDLDVARQKAAENKMDGDQKAMDMPLLESLAGVKQ